jgi:citrate synthase
MQDPQAEDNSPEANLEKAIKLLARIPTIIATDYRFRTNQERIPPRQDLSFAENFFHMCFGQAPEQSVLRCFDVSLILYAELGFGPSTFTARVVASSLSDMYSAVTAAIGSLKGPLHGGANAGTMHTLQEIGEPENVQAWVDNALTHRRTIIGFGHRIFKRGDPRVPILHNELQYIAQHKNAQKWLDMQSSLAKILHKRKRLCSNLDSVAGLAYYLMGFNTELATPIFAMSRVTGWTAHIIEQLAANKLIRPIGAYTGPAHRFLAK